MTSHELARKLLAKPDLPVVSGLQRSGWGEPVDGIAVIKAAFMDEDGKEGKTEKVIDLILSDDCSHTT